MVNKNTFNNFLQCILRLWASAAFALAVAGTYGIDSEITNFKGGIDVIWQGEKGTDYQEEYWYYDKLVNDTKSVWIRSDTVISMSHNDRNVGSVSGRQKVLIGENGGGKIRYKIDGIWDEKQWSRNWDGSGTTYPAYPGAGFTIGSTGIVGKVGYDQEGNHWNGMVDSYGDEWHVLMVADDDEELGGIDDSWASDGKYVLLCVDPKTPAMSIRANGDGQYYTTPAWTYWVPKIHDQVTYFQGACTFELNNIYGDPISYKVNGGGVVNVGGPSVVLDQDDFQDGENTLQYWYTSSPSVVRTRKIVENPGFPSSNEDHGERFVGGDRGWELFKSRASRQPYLAVIEKYRSRGGAGQSNWDNLRRKGVRFGGTNWPYQNYEPGSNALIAKIDGWNKSAEGSTKSYATYSKEMLLESPLTQHPVGFETSFWAAAPIPAADIIYRGYWDANWAYSASIAYDVLLGGFRSDQIEGGVTPIEDYYLRDMLASWCHLAALQLGGVASEYDSGMWTVSRAIGAAWCAAAMPSYSTPYYGTSGFDGNTSVYQWAPFQRNNHTWKDYFFDDDHLVGSINYAEPVFRLGLEGPQDGYGVGSKTSKSARPLIRDPSESPFAVWADKAAYASWGQCGHNIANYALLVKEYGDLSNHPFLLEYINQATNGTLTGQKNPVGPTRVHMITLLNESFPQAARNATRYIQDLDVRDSNSEAKALEDAGLLSVAFYDDQYFGGEVTPTVSTPTISPVSSEWNSDAIEVSIDCETPGAVVRYTLDGSEPTQSSSSYSGPFIINDTVTVKARAFLSGYNDSGIQINTYQFGNPKLSAPTFSNGSGTYTDKVSVSIEFDSDSTNRFYRLNQGDWLSYAGTIEVNQTGSLLEAYSVADGYEDSLVSEASYIVKALPPSISPEVGVYLDPVDWSVAHMESSGRSVVTLDGSVPGAASSGVLSGTLESTTTIRARSIEVPGKEDSDIVSKLIQVGASGVSGTHWTNIPIDVQAGEFRVSWKSVFTSGDSDSVVNCVTGLSDVQLTSSNDYSPLAVSARAMTHGGIDARNGSSYQFDNVLTYELGQEYQFHVDVIIRDSRNEFTLMAGKVNGQLVSIASGFSFRTGTGDLESVRYLAFRSSNDQDSHTVYDVAIGAFGGGGSVPSDPSNLISK